MNPNLNPEKTLHKVFQDIVLKINALYSIEESVAIANRLIELFFGLSPAARVMQGDNIVSEKIQLQLEPALTRILNHEPVQYVVGKTCFLSLEFNVTPAVLIPRPETEELTQHIINKVLVQNPGQRLIILDIGTGSGCIAISLKHYLPDSEVFAMDISPQALKIASENALFNQVKITFVEADILNENDWEKLPDPDIIVSNPPYVLESEKALMQANVLDFEPSGALFVPDAEPLLYYRAIAGFAKSKLKINGSLWLEINEKYGRELQALVKENGFRKVELVDDFHGRNRFIVTNP